jgi:hypothetical protein
MIVEMLKEQLILFIWLGKRNLILPGLVLPNRSCLLTLGVSPDVATANACVAAAELVRRRDDRDDVTTTPGKTFFNEPSAALRKLWRGDERTSLKRLAK